MTLFCRQYGKHRGVPLVLVHGFFGGGEFFSPNIQQLQKHIDIVTVDLPGFGQSYEQPGASSIRDMAEQATAALDSLACRKFHLLGHSMGGMVALQMALSAPQCVASLILYATNSDGDIPDRFETFEETKVRLSNDLEAAKEHICKTWFRDGERHPHYPLVRRCAENVRLQTAINAVDAMKNFNASKELPRIAHPTLIIGAEKDKTYSPRYIRKLHARIPRARLRILSGCAHNAHLEKEEEFNALLLRWLETNAP